MEKEKASAETLAVIKSKYSQDDISQVGIRQAECWRLLTKRLWDPLLAEKIGEKESAMLCQILYWAKWKLKKYGVPYFYNSMEKWRENFPNWSERTIQRGLRKLHEDLGLICRLGNPRTTYYGINYDKLFNLLVSVKVTAIGDKMTPKIVESK